ncbi:MAG: methyltransferase domain-containing protein [Nocardioides sp.]|uniref:class I SAM-dependent methyltransferase n=1 Tax=Nocardioides sp. TaxID=35761 RepID=UPI0039E6DA74
MDEDVRRHARSFGSVAQAYDRGRPSYPREAVQWLIGRRGATVLELGAGTGKLTAELIALGHDVHATDPDDAMLDVLRERVPRARVSNTSAEEIPLGDRSVDVVIAAQAFHWFDHDLALPEIARVLRPGGHLALVWNLRDERIPWVRRLGRLIGTQEQDTDPAEMLVNSKLFGFVEQQEFKSWQDVNRESILDLVASSSNVAVLDEEQRAAKLAEVLAFYDDYGRGMDGMQLPYVVSCHKALVVDKVDESASAADSDEGVTLGKPSDGTDTDMLLIDFR